MPDNKRDILIDGLDQFIKPKKKTNHLLIIGIDAYANDIPSLYNAVRDANNFRTTFLEAYDFEATNCTVLLNEEATRGNIIATFANLLNKLTEEDNLIFCYSGHGIQVKQGKGNRGYWIPYDATLGHEWTYLPNEEITLLFRNSKAHHIFGIVDSCFSGSLFISRSLSAAEAKVTSYPSRWLLTAGRLEPVGDGALGENSPFATALLAQLKGNPANTLWTADLCNAVLRNVGHNTTNQTPRGEPLQNVGHQGGQFVFVKKGGVTEITIAPNIKKDGATRNSHAQPVYESIEKSTTPIVPLGTIKKALKKNLSSGLRRFLPAFQAILAEESIIYEDLSQLSDRYNRAYRKYTILGTITNEAFTIEENRITQAIIYSINNVEMPDFIPNISQKKALYPLNIT